MPLRYLTTPYPKTLNPVPISTCVSCSVSSSFSTYRRRDSPFHQIQHLPVLDSLQNISRQLPIQGTAYSVAQRPSGMLRTYLPQAEGDNSLLSQIQSFCAEHYTDPSFSLSMVAAQFYLSESNLSKLFKTHTGVTFFQLCGKHAHPKCREAIAGKQALCESHRLSCGVCQHCNLLQRLPP